MNILDYLILIIIILGALYGYKRGFIGSLINFIGTIVVIILAFYLKNPISVFLYEHFPFFKISGFYSGISVYNILIYEGISFLITFRRRLSQMKFNSYMMELSLIMTTSLLGLMYIIRRRQVMHIPELAQRII